MNENNKQYKILIVDDERFYINVLTELLKDTYQIAIAKSGEDALERVRIEPVPDLILLDILMPGIDGYEVCRQLKSNPLTANIPVIFLTIKSEVEDEIRGFKLGATDYITKPMSPPIARARIDTQIALKEAHESLSQQNVLLEARVQERTKEVSHTQDVAIYCLASLVETRDCETGHHIRRTQHYMRLLAENLKDNPRFSPYLTPEHIDLLFKSAPLHDIGKVGVADNVLRKLEPLTTDDWAEIKKHPAYGKEAIDRTEAEMGHTSFLDTAKVIAYTHHEKWNGKGYPQGLKGDDIPVAGRLMALADVYDALISKRIYKPAFSHEKAVGIITEQRGEHFDPDIVDAFLHLQDDFNQIAQKYQD